MPDVYYQVRTMRLDGTPFDDPEWCDTLPQALELAALRLGGLEADIAEVPSAPRRGHVTLWKSTDGVEFYPTPYTFRPEEHMHYPMASLVGIREE